MCDVDRKCEETSSFFEFDDDGKLVGFKQYCKAGNMQKVKV